MHRGGRGSGRGAPSTAGGVSGNQETGLFTAAGRDRASGGIGGSATGRNEGRGGGGVGGPMRDNGRKRSGKRPSGLRGSGAHLPLAGGRSDRDGDMDMGDKKSSTL
jgi:hypothetical protein